MILSHVKKEPITIRIMNDKRHFQTNIIHRDKSIGIDSTNEFGIVDDGVMYRFVKIDVLIIEYVNRNGNTHTISSQRILFKCIKSDYKDVS